MVGVHLLHTGVDGILRDRSRVAVGEVDHVAGPVLQLSRDRVVAIVDGRGRVQRHMLRTPAGRERADREERHDRRDHDDQNNASAELGHSDSGEIGSRQGSESALPPDPVSVPW